VQQAVVGDLEQGILGQLGEGFLVLLYPEAGDKEGGWDLLAAQVLYQRFVVAAVAAAAGVEGERDDLVVAARLRLAALGEFAEFSGRDLSQFLDEALLEGQVFLRVVGPESVALVAALPRLRAGGRQASG